MADEELPFGELGDLVEQLVPIAADLVQVVREEGQDAIRGCLLRVPTEVRVQLDILPGGTMGVLAVVLAAMVSPDAGMRSLLGWTDTMTEGPRRARRDSRREPPAERERQRLVSAGVPADTAILHASRVVVEDQDSTRTRMLRVVHGGQESA